MTLVQRCQFYAFEKHAEMHHIMQNIDKAMNPFWRSGMPCTSAHENPIIPSPRWGVHGCRTPMLLQLVKHDICNRCRCQTNHPLTRFHMHHSLLTLD
jgi:hypothetical protein